MEDVSSRIVEKAISLGCQDAIADVITNRSYQIRFAQNEAVISNRWRESTASVFFVYDKRVLASYIKARTQPEAAVEPLPVHPGARVARVERPWDRLRDEALPVQSREGRSEGGTHRRPGAVPETREGRTIHRRVRPADLRVSDGPDGRTPRRVDRH